MFWQGVFPQGGGGGGGGGGGPSTSTCPGGTTYATLTGSQNQYRPGTVPSGQKIVADSATWTGQLTYPVTFGTGVGGCFQGGTIWGTWQDGVDPWTTYHGTGGINLRSAPGGIVTGTTIIGYGDSFRVEDGSPGFQFRRVHAIMSHDDCFEDDHNWGGAIVDSFFESCYSGISMASSFDPTIKSGKQRTLSVTRSIVRMEPMQSVYSGTSPGHGAWFKLDCATSPQVRLDNVVLVAGLYPTNHQNYNPPCGLVHCANVKILWTGDGTSRHPLAFPTKSAWQSACPGVDITDNDPTGAQAQYDLYKSLWTSGAMW